MDRKHFLQGIIFIIIVLSIINYKLINENPAIKISEQNVKFNDSKEINYETEGHIGAGGACICTIGHPITEVRYSNTFKSKVFRYIIPFRAKNMSNNDSSEIDVDNTIVVISAGNVWYSLPRYDEENNMNKNTKWKLKPGEVSRGYAIVDVVINDIYKIQDLKKFTVHSVAKYKGKIERYNFY
ncbi:MAG: hypothetical protein SOR72_01470 [Hornefia sp.]|nr:hypothetical protein [Hornefia sp.]